MARKLKPSICWMIRSDFDEILAIDCQSHTIPMDTYNLIELFSRKNVIGKVATIGRRRKVVGYVFYELDDELIRVLRIAVHPKYRRRNVGRALLQMIEGRLSKARRSVAVIDVNEYNDAAHYWLRACGWIAVGTFRASNWWEDSHNRFCFDLMDFEPETIDCTSPMQGHISLGGCCLPITNVRFQTNPDEDQQS